VSCDYYKRRIPEEIKKLSTRYSKRRFYSFEIEIEIEYRK
jgi:hypothetical protein